MLDGKRLFTSRTVFQIACQSVDWEIYQLADSDLDLANSVLGE